MYYSSISLLGYKTLIRSKECTCAVYIGREHIRCKPTSPCELWKNVNLGHRINIQGEGCREYLIQERVQIVKLPNSSCLLDVDPIIQIEVFIVCTERLVCTQYVPIYECYKQCMHFCDASTRTATHTHIGHVWFVLC